MLRLFSLVLVFASLAQAFQSGLVYAAFQLNRQFIATEQCRFKSEANNTCKGCCVLKKNLKQAEEEKSNGKASCLYQQHETQPLNEPKTGETLAPIVFVRQLIVTIWQNNELLPGFNSNVFQPPRSWPISIA